jgi:hypothetical protein
MIKFSEAVLKPVEIKVIEVILDALTGLKSFAIYIFGNFALGLCDALANAFVHNLISFFDIVLIIIDWANFRQRLV